MTMLTTEKTNSDRQSRRWQPHFASYENLVAGLRAFAGKRQFSTWKLIQQPGKPKPSKVPFTRNGKRLTGSFSDPVLLENLMNLEEAIAAVQRLGHHGVGLVFTPNCGIVGLDLDACIVAGQFIGTPAQQEALAAFEAHSFVEHSQSGSGLHAIALGNAATNKHDGELELFGDKNFLALTGLNGRGMASEIPAPSIDIVDSLVCQLKGEKQRNPVLDVNLNSDLTAHLKGLEGQASIDTVTSALHHLDPGKPREQWLTVVWAVRHGLGDTSEGVDLVDRWSEGDFSAEGKVPDNYSGRQDVEQVWNSYDPNHPDRVTVGSLFKMATDNGWAGPGHTEGDYSARSQRKSESATECSGAFKLTDGDVQISETPPAKRSYVFADTVTAGTFNVLAGSGGTLKTMLMMISAASMAVGQDLGDVRIAQGAAMLFLGEEDHAEISRRLGATCNHYGFDPAVVSRLVKAFPAAGVDLRLTREMNGSIDASALVENVISLAKQHAQACGDPVRLIVFDHARLVMDGNPDDAANVTQLTRVLAQIAIQTSAAVFLLAHSPKTVLRQQAKEMSIADVAGSSAFSDNARSGFIMYAMREDDAKALQVPEAERKKYVKLECAKANYGPQGTAWWFEKVTLDDWQTAVLKPVSLIKPMFGQGQAKQQLRQRILDLLTSAPLSVRAIRDRAGQRRPLGASEKEALAAVDALLEDGRIERRKPMPAEVQQFRLQKGREVLFVV
jgi:RecA-family ATPase